MAIVIGLFAGLLLYGSVETTFNFADDSRPNKTTFEQHLAYERQIASAGNFKELRNTLLGYNVRIAASRIDSSDTYLSSGLKIKFTNPKKHFPSSKEIFVFASPAGRDGELFLFDIRKLCGDQFSDCYSVRGSERAMKPSPSIPTFD